MTFTSLVKLCAAILLNLPMICSFAASACPRTSVDRVWASECFEKSDGILKVKKPFRKNVVQGAGKFTAVVLADSLQLVTIARDGSVRPVTNDVAPGFDFEPGDGEIARFGYFARPGRGESVLKCGYYKGPDLQVIIPPVYDQCGPLKNGTALVCLGCTSHCESGDCHDTDFVGGRGFIINEKNQIIERIELPTLPLCTKKIKDIKVGVNCRASAAE